MGRCQVHVDLSVGRRPGEPADASNRERALKAPTYPAKRDIHRDAASETGAKPLFRLAVLNSHPVQYFAPFYSHLNRHGLVDVTALYCSDASLRGGFDSGFGQRVRWDLDLLSGYRSVFIGGDAAGGRTPRGFWSLVCPEVWHEVRRGGYDAVVLHGYNYAVSIIALLAAKTAGIPVLMRTETHARLRRPSLREWVRDRVLRSAYRYVNGFLAIGTANADYYRTLGVPDARIFSVPYAVDNNRFSKAAATTEGERARTRRAHGIPCDLPVVLYASKLSRRKHPDSLVRAVASVATEHPVALAMVGNGEMRDELQALASRLKLRNIVFTGFVNQSELPRIYAASDIFVLPSENEPWGLVVNEAMCAGLPLIVSREAGCAGDLVREGVNGFLVSPGDDESLRCALLRLVVDRELRLRMGVASRAIVAQWGYDEAQQGVIAALAAVTSGTSTSS